MRTLLRVIARLLARLRRPECEVCFHVGVEITDADLYGRTDHAEFLRSRLRDHYAIVHNRVNVPTITDAELARRRADHTRR